jgi:hypothetical protein
MAIQISYPTATIVTLGDRLLGTQYDSETGAAITKNFAISSIVSLAEQSAASLYAPLAGATFTGNVIAPLFIKAGGTAAQYLMANGSTSTAPTLQQVVDAGNYSENAILIDVASAGNSGPAVSGIAGEDTGVYGASDYGWGIFGQSEYTYGVYGYSTSGFGGYFSSNSSYSLVAAQSAAKPGGGSWSVFSDSRIKENIIPYTKGLADILLINTVTYDYNGLAGTTKGAKYTGVIAQEMKEIFPETVSTYKAKLNEEDEEKTELYDFNSSDLIFALINAVKELKAEIELLKSK